MVGDTGPFEFFVGMMTLLVMLLFAYLWGVSNSGRRK